MAQPHTTFAQVVETEIDDVKIKARLKNQTHEPETEEVQPCALHAWSSNVLTCFVQAKVAKLRKLFNYFDKDHSDEIDKKEFKQLLIKVCKTFGETIPQDEKLEFIMASADSNWDGKISFQEFVDFMKDFPLLLELYRD